MDEADAFHSALYDARVNAGIAAGVEKLAHALLDETGLTLKEMVDMRSSELRAKIAAACEKAGIADIFSNDLGFRVLVRRAAQKAEAELENLPLRDIKKSAEAADLIMLKQGHSAATVAMLRARQAVARNSPTQPVERTRLQQRTYGC